VRAWHYPDSYATLASSKAWHDDDEGDDDEHEHDDHHHYYYNYNYHHQHHHHDNESSFVVSIALLQFIATLIATDCRGSSP
jgi:ABC-type Zn2+ transport system substrate-binding protein/surface adhesin